MLPGDGSLSGVAHIGTFLEPAGVRTVPLVDVELGGTALNDGVAGLYVQLWTVRYARPDVIVSAPTSPDTVLFSREGITELGLAFDQNMSPFVAFVQEGAAKYWWFDTQAGGHVFSDLPVGSITPRCGMDDKRDVLLAGSDIILAYVRGTNLYYRLQRDRYTVEYLLKTAAGSSLVNIGMNTQHRFQFRLMPLAP